MSFLFGPSTGHKDTNYEHAARSQRLHMARDLNDQRTLRGDEERRIGRRKIPWVLLVILLVFILLVSMGILSRKPDLALEPNCTTPGIVAQKAELKPGEPVVFRAAGPPAGSYVVLVDGDSYQPAAGGAAESFTGTVAQPPFTMRECLSETFYPTGPTEPGEHRLQLLRQESSGVDYAVAASITFSVS